MNAQQEEGVGVVSDDEMKTHLASPDWVHCVSMVTRPHLYEFMRDLEWTHYPPDGPRNDEFQVRLMRWGGLHWALVSVPASDKHLMEEAAARHGLRLAEGSSIIMASGDGVERLPWAGAHVFPLQPALSSGSRP